MKKLCLAVAPIVFALGGCSTAPTPEPSPTSTSNNETGPDEAPPSTSPTSTSPADASKSTAPESHVEEVQPDPELPASDAPVAVDQVPAEPTVVECLEGTPGPARWSDGTVSYSQWCFDTRGGEQYLENERQAGLGETEQCVGPAAECGYGTADNGARNPTSGEIQTYHGCQDGYIDDPDLCSAVEDIVRAADPNGSIYQ